MPPKQKVPSDGAVVFDVGPLATNANQNIIWQGIVGSEDRAAASWANSYQRYVKDRPDSQMPSAAMTYPVKKFGTTGMLLADNIELPPMPKNRCRDTSEFKQRPRGVPYMLPPRKYVKQWNHVSGPYKQYENVQFNELPEKHVMHEVSKGIHHTRGSKPLAPTRYIRGAGVKDWVSYLSASGKNNHFNHETTHTQMCGPRTLKPKIDPLIDPCEVRAAASTPALTRRALQEYSIAANGPDGVSVNDKAEIPVCLGKQQTLNDLRRTADGTLKIEDLQALHNSAQRTFAMKQRATEGDRGPGVMPGVKQQWPGVAPCSREFSAMYGAVTPTPNETIRAKVIEEHTRRAAVTSRMSQPPSARTGTARSRAESVATQGSMRDEVEALKQQVAQLQAQVSQQGNSRSSTARSNPTRSKSAMWPMPTVASGPMHTPMKFPSSANPLPTSCLQSRENDQPYDESVYGVRGSSNDGSRLKARVYRA